jgi:hypothetical protein
MNNQIEEMAKIIESIEMPENEGIAPANKKEALIEAETLFNAGYRKVNAGDVVISKEQNEKWLKFLESNMQKQAKDILQKTMDFIEAFTNDQYIPDATVRDIEVLKEYIKIGIEEEYGVELKEVDMTTNKEKQKDLDRQKWDASRENRCDMSGKMDYCKHCKYCVENTCKATQAKREEQSLCAKADNKMQRSKNETKAAGG